MKPLASIPAFTLIVADIISPHLLETTRISDCAVTARRARACYRRISIGQESVMTALTPSPFTADGQTSTQEVTGDNHLTIPAAAGFFAVIDGPSGVGKTTVTSLTSARLAEVDAPVLATRQPSDSPLGRLARSGTHELRGLSLTYLMAADRYHHYEQVILPALNAGRVVVCDRYVTTATGPGSDGWRRPGVHLGHLPVPSAGRIWRSSSPVTRLCAVHARQRRGVYSRFHEGGTDAGKSEAALYASTAGHAGRVRLPIAILLFVTAPLSRSPEPCSALIRDRMTTRNHDEGEP